MKTINYIIDDFFVGKKCFVENLDFSEKENYFFSKDPSFYRRYTLELGLDICILRLDMKEEVLLNQLKSLNPLFYTRVLEITSKESNAEIKISHNDGFIPTSLTISEKQKLRCFWFSFSSRWLENKALAAEEYVEKFSIPCKEISIPQNPYFHTLYNEIFDIADKTPLDNFKLKLKLYAFLDLLMLSL
ncbi:MAG TPA: hypothetical protein VK175_12990 [Leadbetterella sp.]|nr:hypothetical protein [Leadbetterella sp.]